jgi:hypothetical protein
MNVAAKERKSKERWPEDYCSAKDCLWRVRTREGVKPCPKHGARLAGLAPETIDLMDSLVKSLRDQQGTAPVLSEDELQLIRAKVAGGSFDELDAGALLDHIDYLTDAYEQLVQRGAQEADRGQALVLEKEEQIERLRARRHRGFAGHLIVSDYCRFHLSTEVGDVLVSTIGAYVSPSKPDGFTTIGCGRLYETMVFRLGATVCDCGCGEREVASFGEIDFAGYNDPRAATDGHEAMIEKYEQILIAAPVAAGVTE